MTIKSQSYDKLLRAAKKPSQCGLIQEFIKYDLRRSDGLC